MLLILRPKNIFTMKLSRFYITTFLNGRAVNWKPPSLKTNSRLSPRRVSWGPSLNCKNCVTRGGKMKGQAWRKRERTQRYHQCPQNRSMTNVRFLQCAPDGALRSESEANGARHLVNPIRGYRCIFSACTRRWESAWLTLVVVSSNVCIGAKNYSLLPGCGTSWKSVVTQCMF